MESAANADQIEYWNSAAGQKWATFQAQLDRRFAPVIDLLRARAPIVPGAAILEVGCGTGALTLALAESVGPSGAVEAVDIAAPLLALARQRVDERGFSQIRLVRADAQTHPFEQAGFDLILSRFGVMFFNDPIAAFGNLGTALRPDGRLVFACWAPLADNPLFALPLEVGIRHLGAPEPQSPRAPGPLAFSEHAYVTEILVAAGLTAIEVERVATTLPCAATAADEAGFASSLGPAARLIRLAEPDQATVAALVADLTEALEPYQTETGIELPATVFLVTARRG